jgi:hypothetical protein
MAEQLKRIIVTVADDALNNIQQLADKLTAKGMKVERVMPVTGVISGSVAPDKIPALEREAGVLGVEEEFEAQLLPPDSPKQ